MLGSLFNKFAGLTLRPTTLFKRDFITGVSCEYCEIFPNTNSFFYRALRLLLLLV